MEARYPAAASALARGRRGRRTESRLRRRTAPVTFAEIKEVDEENSEAEACEVEERKRRPDVLEPLEELGRQFAEFRRRRGRPEPLRESPPPSAGTRAGAHAAMPRAGSEPAALHRAHT